MWSKSYWLGALLGIFLLATAARAQQAVRWAPNLEEAKRAAGQTGRLVMIEFWAPWCGACRKMGQEVFGRADVGAVLEPNYIPVKLNIDQFPTIARQYGVTALPAVVITGADGRYVERLQGALPAARFLGALDQIARNARPRAPRSPGLAGTPPRGGNQVALQQAPPGARYPTKNAAPSLPSPQTPTTADLGPRYSQRPPVEQDYRRPASPNTGALPGESPRYARPEPRNGMPAQPAVFGGGPPAYRGPVAAYSAGAPGQPPGNPSPATAQQPPAMSPPASPPPASQSSAEASCPLGIEGYCPVHLVDQRQWVMGDRRWGARHEGRLYLFAGPEEQKRFLADPHRYGPVMSGNDVVLVLEQGQTVAGRREHGVFFSNRIYLFANEASLEKFSKRPNYYANAILHTRQAVQYNKMYR